MKLIITFLAFAISFVGAAPTQPLSKNDLALLETLQTRGETLLGSAKKAVDELKHSGHSYLGFHLQHEIAMTEMMMNDVRKIKSTASRYQIHVLEEELLRNENSIADELYIIEQVKKEVGRGETAGQLVARASALLDRMLKASAKHASTPEGKAIRHEGYIVQALIKELQAKTADSVVPKEEQTLSRMEKTFEYLLEKAEFRNPSRPPFHPGGGHY